MKPKDTFVRAKMAERPPTPAEADRQWARDNAAALIGGACVVIALALVCALVGAYLAIYRAVHHLP